MAIGVWHHGTETETIDSSLVPIQSIENAIVGIVGTAPIGPVNELVLCQTAKDFAQFGNLSGYGYTLPDAFKILQLYGAGKFYVINVLDPSVHAEQVTDEALTVNEITLRAQTARIGLKDITVKDNGTPLVENTDYTVERSTGVIVFGTLPTAPTVSYKYADPSKVIEDEVKGGFNAIKNRREGWELMRDGFNLFGADAKILVCPQYGQSASMARTLEAYAEQLNAIAYIQAPRATTVSQALAGRGPLGTINFNTAAKSYLFFDHINEGEELATHAAGLRMYIDVTKGYWHSISNKELKGVTKTDIPLTARIDDYQSETNLLNAKGITTVFNSYGTGYRMWGNRMANFPALSSGMDSFEVCWRTKLLIDESIRKACLLFVDEGIDQVTIDRVLDSVDAYLRDLTGTGPNRPLLGASVWWSENNSETQLAQGHYYIAYKFTPKVPGERITFESEMTSEYLGVLNQVLLTGRSN